IPDTARVHPEIAYSLQVHSNRAAVPPFPQISCDHCASPIRLPSNGVAKLPLSRPRRPARRSGGDDQSILRVRNASAVQGNTRTFDQEFARAAAAVFAGKAAADDPQPVVDGSRHNSFSLFLFGIPYLVGRAMRRHEPIPPVLAVVAFLWFTFLSVSVAFSLVHYEARHALPIFPAGCIGLVYTYSAPRQWLRRPEAKPSPA